MENLILSPVYETNVPSIHVDDPVRGATTGIPNEGIVNDPHVKIGNRTAYLKGRQDLILSDYAAAVGQAIDNYYYAIQRNSTGWQKVINIPMYIASPPGMNLRSLDTEIAEDAGTEPGYIRMGTRPVKLLVPRNGCNRLNYEVTISSSEINANNKFRIMVYKFWPGTSPYCIQLLDVEHSGDSLGHKTGGIPFGSEIQNNDTVELVVSMRFRTAAFAGNYIQVSNSRIWTSTV